MTTFIAEYLQALWAIVLELSPPLLGGLIFAGLIHLIIPAGFIHRTLSKRGLGSVFKSVMVGVPMPLCSCGVVPTALGLRKEGASNGAIYRTLGLKLLMVYLGTLISMSILFALLFEALFSEQIVVTMHQHSNDLLGLLSTIILGLVTLWLFYYRHQQKNLNTKNLWRMIWVLR